MVPTRSARRPFCFRFRFEFFFSGVVSEGEPLSTSSLFLSLFSLSLALSLSPSLLKHSTHIERPAQPVAVVGPEVGRRLDEEVRVEAVHERRDRRPLRVDAEHAEHGRLGEVAAGAQALVRG